MGHIKRFKLTLGKESTQNPMQALSANSNSDVRFTCRLLHTQRKRLVWKMPQVFATRTWRKGTGEYLMGSPHGLTTYRMTDHTWHHSQNSGIHFWLNKDTLKAWPASAYSHPVCSEQMRGSSCGGSLMIGIWQLPSETVGLHLQLSLKHKGWPNVSYFISTLFAAYLHYFYRVGYM